MALQDGGDVIRGLEGFVLQSLDPVSLVIAGCRRLDPAHAVQVVLAAEIPHQLRQLDERLGVPCVLDADDVRDARSHCWRARTCAATAAARCRCSTAIGATGSSKSSSSKRGHSFAG